MPQETRGLRAGHLCSLLLQRATTLSPPGQSRQRRRVWKRALPGVVAARAGFADLGGAAEGGSVGRDSTCALRGNPAKNGAYGNAPYLCRRGVAAASRASPLFAPAKGYDLVPSGVIPPKTARMETRPYLCRRGVAAASWVSLLFARAKSYDLVPSGAIPPKTARMETRPTWSGCRAYWIR